MASSTHCPVFVAVAADAVVVVAAWVLDVEVGTVVDDDEAKVVGGAPPTLFTALEVAALEVAADVAVEEAEAGLQYALRSARVWPI